MHSKNPRVRTFELLESRIVFSHTYFIDPLNGDDANTGLSAAEALRTPLKLVAQYDSLKPPGHLGLEAGDTVVLMPGVHNFAFRYGEGQWQGLFLRGFHGQAGKPITIRGMEGARVDNRAPDGTEMASITILQSSHVVLENLDITSYGSAVFVADSSDILIRDNYIHDVDGVAANNLSGVYLAGAHRTRIEDNLFVDNFDRSRPGNANNRHIVIFGSVDVGVFGNTLKNTNAQSGMAVDYKHLGGLTAQAAGSYEVAHNIIINAAGTAIGSAAPNSYIHHNLLVDSGSIRIADFGGTNQLSNERIEYNTIVNSLHSDGGGLSYYPNEYPGFPLGRLSWAHNFVVDSRDYNHPEKATLQIDQYGPDSFYRRVIDGDLFHAEGNQYQTKDLTRFGLYSANGGNYGQLGSSLSFSQWQAAGYDRSGSASNIAIDAYYRSQKTEQSQAGIYAGTGPRITAFLDSIDLDELGSNSTTTLRIIRSGMDNRQSLTVAITPSQVNELAIPGSVTIPAGSDAIEVVLRGLGDRSVDALEAIQLGLSANGCEPIAVWVRLHDSPPPTDGDMSNDPPHDGRLTAGVFQVPGASGQSVKLESRVLQRYAEYNNEMGVAYVDDAQGRVNNLLPSDPGWTTALLRRGTHQVVLRSGVTVDATGQVALQAGRYFVFYLVQNASTANWLETNPSNQLGRGPLLFTSIATSNPDRYDHVHERLQAKAIQLAWEDLEFGGDESFLDLVVENRFSNLTTNYCQAIDDSFVQFHSGQPSVLDVIPNDLLATPGTIQTFNPIQSGEPTQLEDGRLVLEVLKPWTNLNNRSDVNGDGRITALDVLLVINALNEDPNAALLPNPQDDTHFYAMIDVDRDQRVTLQDAWLVMIDWASTFAKP